MLSASLLARMQSCDCSSSRGPPRLRHSGTALPPPRAPPEPHFPWRLCPLSEPQQPMAKRTKGTRLGVVRAVKFPVFTGQNLLFFAHWAHDPWPGDALILFNPSGSLFSPMAILRKQLPMAGVGRVEISQIQAQWSLSFYPGHLPVQQFIHHPTHLAITSFIDSASHSLAFLPTH